MKPLARISPATISNMPVGMARLPGSVVCEEMYSAVEAGSITLLRPARMNSSAIQMRPTIAAMVAMKSLPVWSRDSHATAISLSPTGK